MGAKRGSPESRGFGKRDGPGCLQRPPRPPGPLGPHPRTALHLGTVAAVLLRPRRNAQRHNAMQPAGWPGGRDRSLGTRPPPTCSRVLVWAPHSAPRAPCARCPRALPCVRPGLRRSCPRPRRRLPTPPPRTSPRGPSRAAPPPAGPDGCAELRARLPRAPRVSLSRTLGAGPLAGTRCFRASRCRGTRGFLRGNWVTLEGEASSPQKNCPRARRCRVAVV